MSRNRPSSRLSIRELANHEGHPCGRDLQHLEWEQALVEEEEPRVERDPRPRRTRPEERPRPVVVGKDAELAGPDRLRHRIAQVVRAKRDHVVLEHLRHQKMAQPAVDHVDVAKRPVRVRLQIVPKDLADHGSVPNECTARWSAHEASAMRRQTMPPWRRGFESTHGMAWLGALEILDLVIRELHTDPKPSLVQRRHVRH